MTLTELVALLAADLPTAVVLTDAELIAPGPRILYVNAAFSRMTGYDAGEVIGRNPRLLQGARTHRLVLRRLARSLAAGQGFRGQIVNYRKSGERYLCEVDIHPVTGTDGQVTHFVAFEREVPRRWRRQQSEPGPTPFKGSET